MVGWVGRGLGAIPLAPADLRNPWNSSFPDQESPMADAARGRGMAFRHTLGQYQLRP